MDIETSNAIKHFFPNPSLLLVYFEAVANALDAGATEVSIQIAIEAYTKPESLSITISDNGEGFNDENFSRFKTLLKPRDNYHKGLGRLVFLDYFKSVKVDSTFKQGHREFVFKGGFNEDVPVSDLDPDRELGTNLTFGNFTKERISAYDDLKPSALKPVFIAHFLPTLEYFKREKRSFKIKIALSLAEANPQKDFFPDEAIITPADVPEMKKVIIKNTALDAFAAVDMYYHIESTLGKPTAFTAFNVDGRTIPINLIPPSSFPADYNYVFLFESDLFNRNSDTSRQKLILPDNLPHTTLYRVLKEELGKILVENVPQLAIQNKQTSADLENRYPHLLGYFDTSQIGILDRDEALENAQKHFFKAQKEILECEHLDEITYQKSIQLSSRALMEYVLYRDKIISKMKEMTERNSEAEIHNLIVPRFREFTSKDIQSESLCD